MRLGKPSEVIYPQNKNSYGSSRRTNPSSSRGTSPSPGGLTSPPRRTLFGIFGRTGGGGGSEKVGIWSYALVKGTAIDVGEIGKKKSEAA